MIALELFETVSSTQDIIKQRAQENAPAFTVVQALRQTQGRGRMGRVWQSAEGNLFFSILLRPECRAEDLGQMALLVGLAVAETLDALTPAEAINLNNHSEKFVLKWPNDVLVGGQKIAGILVETSGLSQHRVEWAAVGVGVNVLHAPILGSTCLADLGYNLPLTTLRDAVLSSICKVYQLWKEQGFMSLIDRITPFLPPQDWPMRVHLGTGNTLSGTFSGIDPSGKLLLRCPSGIVKTISSGDVEFDAASN
jgi:BirA family biotin operon repressor/biotin-[acetyl-CoA-carboxylase] ligase